MKEIQLEGKTVLAPEQCEVCDEDWRHGGWGLVHGQTVCANCGAPYRYDYANEIFSLMLDEEGVEMAKEFIENHDAKLYMISGAPVPDEDAKTFNDWYNERQEDYEKLV